MVFVLMTEVLRMSHLRTVVLATLVLMTFVQIVLRKFRHRIFAVITL